MRTNIGAAERAFRIIAGLIILALAFVGPKTPWAYLGLIPLLTGVLGWCPPYALLGISTCRRCKTQASDSENIISLERR